MTDSVSFVVPQRPLGKQRHSTVPLLRCGKCQKQTMGHREACPTCGNKQLYFVANTSYTPADQKEYERFGAMCAQQGMRGRDKFLGPTRVECRFYFEIPKSRTKKLKDGDWHCQRPDADNLKKSVLDFCNGVTWVDDCIISEIYATKQWTTGIPRTVVTISLLADVRPKAGAAAEQESFHGSVMCDGPT